MSSFEPELDIKAYELRDSVTIAAMTSQVERPLKAYLALALGLLILGFSAILVSLADAPGTVVSFYRMAIGTLVLAIPFVRRLRSQAPLSRRGLGFAVLAGVFFGGDLAAWSTGVNLSGATLPTLFANTAPLWVGLGAWLLFKEKLGNKFWLGLVLALSGVALILGLDPRESLSLNTGALLGLLAGFLYGIYFLAAQRGRDSLDVTSFFWVGTLSSAITLLIINLLLGRPLGGFSSTTWMNFITQGIVIQAAAWYLISYAQGFLPASLVAPTLLGQPVLTAVLAGPLLGEFLHSNDLLGGAAVLAGIYMVHRSRRKRSVSRVRQP